MSFSFGQITPANLQPNQLLDLEKLRTAPQVTAATLQNQMLEGQERQQNITGNDIALTGAAFAPLLGMSEEEAAKTYQAVLPGLQQRGIGKYAPATYPGHAATQALVQRAMSVKDQLAQQQNQAGWGQITGDGTTGTGGGGGGGGTNAPPGTSTPTAPQNLADIHPDLTQFSLPSGVGLTVAKSAAPQFQGLLTDLEAAGYKLDPNTTGGYNPRNIAGTNTPSQHAHGLAIDVNWQRNPRGANTPADIPPDLARKLAAKWGLTWGGDWQGADRDPMHFEVARGTGPGTDHPAGVATGWNANNPLNLTTDTGGVVTPGGARLASYGSMADGVAATAAKLQSYQTDRGLDTVRKIYTEWHKGSQVNDADMQRIAGAIGVGLDQPFQLDPAKTAAWITAAQPGETGTAGKRLSPADIAAGVRQASAGGGPGGATAAATPPGVQMGGAAPPPPGGAPGAYGGGGFGAVVGRPPVVGTSPIPAGRPTGPPVVTDQPAGSNVVAGPPGVATVGAPQPPGPAVAGNVAAINAGIAGAGGQPVTDPNATPTPARYAGTAPAPSVEAQPQPGWGTGIGSDYGPQNTLAPTPPVPTQPAAPVVAQQQPPAPVQPAARPTAPAAGGLLAGLSPDQVKAVLALRRSNGTPAQGLAMIEHFKEVNATAAHQTVEEQRQAEADKRAAAEAVRQQAKFDQEMVASNRPYPGNSPEAADNNILIAGSQPGGDTSSPAYANAYARQKYKEASNGNVIARDMSMFKPPTKPDTAPTVTPGPTAIFERENTLRDEFQKLTADFRIVQSSYENLQKTAEKPSGAGDMSLLYSYVRLLDPTSVVRESEFATAAASGSFGERMQGAVGRLISGERLPDSLRQDFVREARNLYDTQLRNHNQTADIYTRIAKQSGVDPDKVVTRFDRPQAPAGLKVIIP